MIVTSATSNAGKLAEFRLAAERFGAGWRVEPLAGLDRLPACEETGASFEENAIRKALYYGPHAPGLLFVDDSGLVVDALAGQPGVLSARWAGPGATDEANNRLLVEKLRGVEDRRARFVCVVALADRGRLVATFRRAVRGSILDQPRGSGGFGYDPLFFHPPYGATLAEVSAARKLEVSHRGLALKAMFGFLHSGFLQNASTPEIR